MTAEPLLALAQLVLGAPTLRDVLDGEQDRADLLILAQHPPGFGSPAVLFWTT
jgi:hypothetical protein